MAKRQTTSVALASYNGEKYLMEQLQSIARQTVLPDQLVVCDDQSSDNTLNVLEDFKSTAPFEVIIHPNETRLGYRRNFFRCASLCSGDVILFCDQDDVWKETKLQTVLSLFDDPDVLLAYHSAFAVDQDLNILGEVYGGTDTTISFDGDVDPWRTSFGFTQALSRRLLDYNDLIDITVDHNKPGILAHDQWYWFLAALLGKVAYTSEKLAFYRQHGGNVDGWGGRRSFRERAVNEIRQSGGYDQFVAACAGRLDIIQRIEAMTPARRQNARALYTEAGRFYQGRQTLYHSAALPPRLATYLAMVLSGRYLRNRYDKYAILRDSLWGLPQGPRSLDFSPS